MADVISLRKQVAEAEREAASPPPEADQPPKGNRKPRA
jgi:hypothetical protein